MKTKCMIRGTFSLYEAVGWMIQVKITFCCVDMSTQMRKGVLYANAILL